MTPNKQPQADSDNNPPESPPSGAAPPAGDKGRRKSAPSDRPSVHCVAIAQFHHDGRTYHPRRAQQAGRKTVQRAADTLQLSRAWAEHHTKAGNVVPAKEYDAWLEKNPGGDS